MADPVAESDQLLAELSALAKPISTFYVELCRLGVPTDDAHWFARDVMGAWLERHPALGIEVE